mgnify:FL=1
MYERLKNMVEEVSASSMLTTMSRRQEDNLTFVLEEFCEGELFLSLANACMPEHRLESELKRRCTPTGRICSCCNYLP